MSEFLIMIKPMLFMGSVFYPSGGWEDFKGYFESADEAKKFCKSIENYEWAHIVINGKIKWKCYTDFDFEKNETIIIWEELNE